MKKLTCLLLALLLVIPVALVGCGSDEVSTAESAPATSTESSKATEDSSDAPSEDASEAISEEPSETPSEEPSQDVSDETSDPGEDPDDPKEEGAPLEAENVNWTPIEGHIFIYLTKTPYLGKSAIEKINSLSPEYAEAVVLITPSVYWWIPCGSQIGEIHGDYLDLTVSVDAQGSQYETLTDALLHVFPDVTFRYFQLEEPLPLPEDTEIAFNLSGLISNNNPVALWAKVSIGTGTALKPVEEGTVYSDGWTGFMEYSGYTNMFVIVD